ncbi:MAG: phosphate-starvation-inducible PsiE family protein [Parachlamydiaceae bacterium]
MKGDESNFPIDVGSPFINFLQKIIIWSIKLLAFFMVIVILWSVADVAFLMMIKAQEPYALISDMEEMLRIFGAFLVVLIAVEIFLNIILYLKKEMSHLKLVVATALMAIARKIIILDYNQIREWQMIGMGAIIFSLGCAYWFIHRASLPMQLVDEKSPK